MACRAIKVITEAFCYFGCGRQARFRFVNGHYCCSAQVVQCPFRRKRLSKVIERWNKTKRPVEFFVDNGIKKQIYSKHWRRCIARRCLYCDKKFYISLTSLRSPGNFCSVLCRNKGLRSEGSANANWKGGLPERYCLNCGRVFVPDYANYRKYGKFCTKSCEHKFRKGKPLSAKAYKNWLTRKNFRQKYDGIWYRSSWEVAFCKFLNDNSIKYEYEKFRFNLPQLGSYTPDFYLKKSKVFIEIKGRLGKHGSDKLAAFYKYYPNIRLYVLFGPDLKRLGVL